jgi:hypothetical protein
MKLHTIGTFEHDGRQIKGVVLEGTTEEVRAIAKLFSAGHDDSRVVAAGESSFTPRPTSLDIATQATIDALQAEVSRLKALVDQATCHVEDFI